VISVALGLIVGLILALTGAGGTIIAVPLLMFTLHLDVAHAAPIALAAVFVAAATGTLLGLREGIVRYRAAGLMAAIGAPFAPLGVWLAHRIAPLPLNLLFIAVLLYVALRMFREHDGDAPVSPPCRRDPLSGRLHWTWRCFTHLGSAGATAGLLSGLLGVGGGFVIVPALRRTTDLTMQAIVASSLMTMTLVSATALAATAYAGHLDLRAAPAFAIATLAGMLLGRRIANRIDGRRLQQGFATILALIAVGMSARLLLAP